MTSRNRRLLLWMCGLALAAGFFSLGVWQLQRGEEKRGMLERAQRALRVRAPQPPVKAWDKAHARGYDWVEIDGEFTAGPPLLLDNQIRAGKPGVRVYRLFSPSHPAGRELLVDMGWLPLGSRRELPSPALLAAPLPAGSKPMVLRGLLAPPPSSGLAMGPAMAMREDGRILLMSRFDLSAIDARAGDPTHGLAPRVLKLDPALPFGYPRDLDILPNTLPPERHLGYAVQWFALAATVLITALVLTLRKSRSRRPPARSP